MQTEQEYEFDLFVIGGGSGGLAASKAAAKLGARVGLADFVKPSPIGTTWGLGGTCVNVGCIPKKLMHYASHFGEMREDQVEAGWTGIDTNGTHDWNKMVNRVQANIKKLNWGYKVKLIETDVTYKNKLAEVVDAHTIKLTDAKGKEEQVTSKYILIAVGGRPTLPTNIPNGEKLVISSDDLFSMKKIPGKTLVVGASYVALECAGFLTGMKYDTTVMVRSILLRGFDSEISEKIGGFMVQRGTKFIRGTVPEHIEETENGQRRVVWKLDGVEHSDVFDTVLYAIGRYADTGKLNLQNVGVKLNKEGKIICSDDDQTSVPSIYAIGDVVQGRPELTPTAIKCGLLLAQRLFDPNFKTLMSYENVATTVFTPLEYGCVGLSEDQSIEKYGDNDVLVYASTFKPLEWNFLDSHDGQICYAKVIVHSQNRKVLGMHYLGPNAGEVIQGYAVAMKMGVTKEQLDETVGIHPTTSEELVQLQTVKGIDKLAKEGC